MSASCDMGGVCGTGDGFFAYQAIRPDLDGIPTVLAAIDQWVLWKAEPKPKGGMNKIPFQPTGRTASATDPHTWNDFGSVWSAYEEAPETYAGVGFVVTPEDTFVGGDMDHCRDANTGELTELAAKIVEALGTYCEVSPSGTGVRFVAYGAQVKSFKGNGIEIYTGKRYLTITGERIAGPEEPQNVPASYLARLRELATGKKPNGSDLESGSSTDPVVVALKAAGLYQRSLHDGRHQVTCPWWEEHSGADRTGSVYMEANYNGFSEARFVCQHSHCGHRHLPDLTAAIQLGEEDENTEAWPPSRTALVVTQEELSAARLSPRCIVKHYLYADVAQIIAPGGTGKTTMLLHEATCIALGRPVWGMSVEDQGWTLFVTKEDRREQLVARLREIMADAGLSDNERRVVLGSVMVLDMAGIPRKLTVVHDGNILQTDTAERIVEAYKADPPVQIIFDPLISFGASEAMVNDNEQALVNVARMMVKGLDCCVRYVHHTGKASARAGITDQYSGRGGTALPDGSRMTTVLEPWDKKETPPPGCNPSARTGLLKLQRHKLSYAPPNLAPIWLRREGFAYEHFIEHLSSREEKAAQNADQLERYLESSVKDGKYHTANTLEAQRELLDMTRAEFRAALAELQASRRVVEVPLSANLRHGGKKAHLCPANLADLVALSGEVG